MEYRVCRNNPAPYNDPTAKSACWVLAPCACPCGTPPTRPALTRKRHRRFLIMLCPRRELFRYCLPLPRRHERKVLRQSSGQVSPRQLSPCQQTARRLLKCDEDVPRIFNEQLANCRTDYFDFYLVHSVHESSWPNYVKYHAYDQLNELRKAGKIKRLGFSFHGSAEQLPEILAAGDWDLYSCSSIILTGTISRAAKNTSCAPLPGCRSSLWSRCAAGC